MEVTGVIPFSCSIFPKGLNKFLLLKKIVVNLYTQVFSSYVLLQSWKDS